MFKRFYRNRLAGPSAAVLVSASLAAALLPLAASANTGAITDASGAGPATETCSTWSARVQLDNNVTPDHHFDVVVSPNLPAGFLDHSIDTTTKTGPTVVWGPFSGPTPLSGTITLTIHLPDGSVENTQTATLAPPTNCTKTNPAITTNLSAGTITVPGSVHDSATLTGATADAGGTVNYAVYTNSACSQGLRDAGTVTVANGAVPDSNTLVFASAGTYSWQATYSGDSKNSGAKSACGTETLTANNPVQSLTGHIFMCDATGNQTPTEVSPAGTIAATGPTTVAAVANPMSSSVKAGTYVENATAPAGFHFATCQGKATVSSPTTANSPDVVVPTGGTNNFNFYVAPNPGTLAGHIYDCTTGATTNEVTGGTLAATGSTPIAAQANPLAPTTVNAGDYVVTATAPPNYNLVACNGTGTAPQTVTVPRDGTAAAVFYVAHQTGSLSADIFDCTAGNIGTTNVPGGTLAATGGTPVAAAANPMPLTTVLTGPYTVTATAPAAFHFVACANQPATGTRTTTVAANTPGYAVFYVSHDTGNLAGHIYDCTSGATTTEVPGGTLGATGATTIATQANPFGPVVVQTGDYTVTGTAPSGYTLALCNGKGAGGTQAVTVPANGTMAATFYVTKNPTPNNGGTNGANGSNNGNGVNGANGANNGNGVNGANGATQPVTGRSDRVRAAMVSLLLVMLGIAVVASSRRGGHASA